MRFMEALKFETCLSLKFDSKQGIILLDDNPLSVFKKDPVRRGLFCAIMVDVPGVEPGPDGMTIPPAYPLRPYPNGVCKNINRTLNNY